jgi:hypothetical protein
MREQVIVAVDLTSPTNTLHILRRLVARASCKPGWSFGLEHVPRTSAFELVISANGPDSEDRKHHITINHHFPVPEATYNERSWRRWLFECCRKVETHELCEWFCIDGERAFPPMHMPGEDPYEVHDPRSEDDARIDQQGR